MPPVAGLRLARPSLGQLSRRLAGALGAALALGACEQPSEALSPGIGAAAAAAAGGEDSRDPPPERVLLLSLAGTPPDGGASVSLSGAASGVYREPLSEVRAPAIRLRLSAQPGEGFAFVRWTGACEGQDGPVCALDLAAAANPDPVRVGAAFGPLHRLLLDIAAGPDAGGARVEVREGGALVAERGPGRWRMEFAPGAAVALSVASAERMHWSWFGDCALAAGGDACELEMDRDRSASARFLSRRGLRLEAVPSRFGRLSCRVLSGEAGPGPCADEGELLDGDELEILASAEPDGLFAGWAAPAACAAQSAEPRCRLRVAGDVAATARFGAVAVLSVVFGGAARAAGEIEVAVPWRAARAVRAENFDEPAPAGAPVTLVASPSAFPESASAPVAFVGWGQDCAARSTAPRCDIAEVSADGTFVEARFAPLRTLSVAPRSLAGGRGVAWVARPDRLARVVAGALAHGLSAASATVSSDAEAEFRLLDEPGLREVELVAEAAGTAGGNSRVLAWTLLSGDGDSPVVDLRACPPGSQSCRVRAEVSASTPVLAAQPWFSLHSRFLVTLRAGFDGGGGSASASWHALLSGERLQAPGSNPRRVPIQLFEFLIEQETFNFRLPLDRLVTVAVASTPSSGSYVAEWGGLAAEGPGCRPERNACEFPAVSPGDAAPRASVSFRMYNRLELVNTGGGSGRLRAIDFTHDGFSRERVFELAPTSTMTVLGELVDRGLIRLEAIEAVDSVFAGWGAALAPCQPEAPEGDSEDAPAPLDHCEIDGELTDGGADNLVPVSLRFKPLTVSTLTVSAEGVDVQVTVVFRRDAEPVTRVVGAGNTDIFRISEESAVTLAFGEPAVDGFLVRWRGCPAPPDNPVADCEFANPALVRDGALVSLAVTGAAVAPTPFTVAASAGGDVEVSGEVVGGGDAVETVPAGAGRTFQVAAGDAVRLVALPQSGALFDAWTLPSGLECAPGAPEAVCELSSLPAASSITVAANFEAILQELSLVIQGNGTVDATVRSTVTTVSGSGESIVFRDVTEADEVVLAARPAEGYIFDRWRVTPDDGDLSCASGPFDAVCELSLAPGLSEPVLALVSAVFDLVDYTVTVRAPASSFFEVTSSENNDIGVSVEYGSPAMFRVTVETRIFMIARPLGGLVFDSWVTSGGIACMSDLFPTGCTLRVTGDGEVTAVLVPPPMWTGPGPVSREGTVFTALEYVPGAFIEWRGGFCDGSTALECDVEMLGMITSSTAVFSPFAANGIKSLAFGLNYPSSELPSFEVSHFQLRVRETGGSGFPPPALDLIDPARAFAELSPLPVHLAPWRTREFITEACSAAALCERVSGAVPVALARDAANATIGYFSAPNPGGLDLFGSAVALSGDGGALAVGASLFEGSAPSGAFSSSALSGPLREAALVSDDSTNTGAVYVYRRDGSRWALEAFIKASRADDDDQFGTAVALDESGQTLAVGAPNEDSSATGAFAPDDGGYLSALANDGSFFSANSGAVYVYRRSTTGQWRVEAFVKASVVDGDEFGSAVALAGDGATLAVGVRDEDSLSDGVFAPADSDYPSALAGGGGANAGAVYVYRRSTTGQWRVEAFVKAPEAGRRDRFGSAVALSGDGATLAVGAPEEDSTAGGAALGDLLSGLGGAHATLPTGVYLPGHAILSSALADDSASGSGAAYVYRRDSSDRWTFAAFVKPPQSGTSGDSFGAALALSADGARLAVGAPFEDSAHGGRTLNPDNAASASEFFEFVANPNVGARSSGAAFVYRRDPTIGWVVEAYVKAPLVEAFDRFGSAVALSGDGATLAVGEPREDSAAAGAFAPDDGGYPSALADDSAGGSGAAYVYSIRSPGSDWRLETFLKGFMPDRNDFFGVALSLSEDGDTLAVGTQESPPESLFGPPRPVGDIGEVGPDTLNKAGTVYLY